MRVSYITVNTNILLGKEQDNILSFLSRKLLENGVTISKSISTSMTAEKIKEALSVCMDNYIFIIGDSTSARNYQIKNILSRFFGATYTQNQAAIAHITNYYKRCNMQFQLESEGEFYLPVGAELLKSNSSVEQGFYFVADKTYVFLPSNVRAVEDIFNNQLLPLLIKDVRAVYQLVHIKTFGISEKDVLTSIQELIQNKYKIFITTYADNLDVTILLRYNKNIDKNILQAFVSNIYEKLKKHIYSNENISLYNLAFDLLKIAGKKLAIAETISGGFLTNKFLSCNPKTHLHFTKSIVTNNIDSLTKVFDVNKSIISQHGLVSVEVAYEMSANMLEKSEADLVVSTCGEWGVDINNATQLVCYIAVGDHDGIHVYKNTYSGNYEAVIDNISKSAMFYLIKKIKQKDLFFSQTVV